jgi:UPF0755 protein
MNFKVILRFGFWLLAFCLLLFMAALFQAANPFDRNRHLISIPKGASTRTVQLILEENKILPKASSFSFAAKLLGLSKNIQAGKYGLSPADPLFMILFKLRRGEVIEPAVRRVKITFPEGTSIYKMAQILRKDRVSDPDKFEALVEEGITEEVRLKHWAIFKYIPSESLEGYLYPDTYWFFENTPVKEIVELMVSRFEEMVLPLWKSNSSKTSFTLHEVLTLASIIEKEAKNPAERAIISSVFHNRLKSDMPLAADPTVKYALEKPTKRVYFKQLSVDSLYNTYKRKGLPPGPICNPGIESIKAAIFPAKTDYYYFVADKKGSHIFSRTLSQHQKAIKNLRGNGSQNQSTD